MAAQPMTFQTVTFFLFLAVVFAAYWLLRNRIAQNVLIVIVSYVFFGWADWRLPLLLCAASMVDYAAGMALGAATGRGTRKGILAASLTINLGVFFVFQYFDFFSAGFAAIARSAGWQVSPIVLGIALPLTLSFYTFQTVGYVVDVYRRDVAPARNPIDYLAFMAFFPQLVIGPIERAGGLLRQFQGPRRFDYDRARDGCRQMLWGLVVKLALADNLIRLIANSDYAYSPASTGPQLILATVCFAFWLYADFSAYTHIALGLGKLFGIGLTRNFAYPYFSQSVGEFWRRWHMSLSTWLRDYVYIPLGGNRKGPWRRSLNILVVFAVSGVWHAAAFGGTNIRVSFLIWGLLNGIAVIAEHAMGVRSAGLSDAPGGRGLLVRPAALGRMALTFAFICLTWVFFRASSVSEAGGILWRMIADIFDGEAWRQLGAYLADKHSMMRTLYLLTAFVVVEWLRRDSEHPLVLTLLPKWIRRGNAGIRRATVALAAAARADRISRRLAARAVRLLPPRWLRWSIYVILIVLTLDVSPEEISAFAYGQF